MTGTYRWRFGVIAALGAGMALSCFSERSSIMDADLDECVQEGVGSAGGVGIGIRNFAFAQTEVRVSAGTRVTWVNCERPNIDPHTTTSDDNIWASPLLSAGQTYSRVFTQPGRYEYHCVPHPSMQGVIIVE